MKKKFKKILASLLVAVIVLTAAPLSGFAGLDLSTTFLTKSNAANYQISVGDVIELGSYNGEPIYWICVGFDDNGPLMFCKDILCLKEFDAAGYSDKHNSSIWDVRIDHGSNCWSDSNIRQWLNTEGKVDYTHCPPSYADEDGFLSCFTASELSLVKHVTRKDYVNSLEYDRGYVDGGSKEFADVSSISQWDRNNSTYWYQLVSDSFFLLGAQEIVVAYKSNPDYLKASKAYFTSQAHNRGYSHDCLYWINADGSLGGASGGTIPIHKYGIRPAFYLDVNAVTNPDTPDDFTESIKFGADRFTFGQDMTGVAGDTFDALLVYASKENDINDLTITSSDPAVATVGTPKIDKGDYITQENERCALLPITLKSAGTATITVTSPTGVSESITIAVEDKEKSIAVLSTEKSFTVKTGESMWLAFGMMVDGKLIGEWKKMSVTVSDPTLILLSEYEKTEYGYSLEVIGKKEGVTNFTITDSETGISTSIVVSVSDDYNKSYSYAISDIETFYPNNKWEDHIATNIYDLNGIYINNYSCSKSDGKYNVSFNAYNQRYHFGSIDIYDADGNWIGSEAIEKNSDISSLYDTGEQIVYMVLDATTGSWLTYEQATFSEKTTVNIEVPEGGYFTISNNFVESPGSFIYNVSDILINGLTAFFDVSSSLGNLKSLKPADLGKEIMNELLADPNVTEAWMDVFKDVVHYRITETVRDFSTSDIDVVCSEITNIFESSLQRVKVDWKDAVKNCAGLAESAFQKFAGPAGLALEGCFAFANVTNTIMQVRHLAASVDEVYVTIYSSIDEGYINPHGVIVNTNGNMDLEAVLQVFRISDNDAIEIILDNKNPLEKHALYNICFVKNDQQVQPNGKVKVYVPIPEGFVGNTCKVYRQESDGSWTILDATVEGNYLTFETDHFSLYAVVGNRAELKITSLPDKLTYLSNQTIDTTGLVLELNGEKIADGYLCEPSITGNAGTQVVTIRYGVATVDFSVQVVNELPSPEPEEKGKVNSVSINDISMSYKDSATVTPSINADSGVKYTVSYSSSDTDVVSVDSNGRLTTNGTGSATITVTVTDEYGNAVTDTCKVEVSYKWWQWIIVIVLFGWIWY